MRVLIFDLLLARTTFHTTPRPTMAALLISGWHKSQGHTVVLADEMPNFNLYDKVYIIKDDKELFHDPKWLTYDNIVLVGQYWNMPTYWNREWNEAIPDQFLYQNWATNWMERYPSISKTRMENFFRKPVKIKQGNRIIVPEGDNLLIIDNDMHIWDRKGEILRDAPIRNASLLYPLQLDRRWDAVLDIFNQRHIKRRTLWTRFSGNKMSDEDLETAISVLHKHKPSRMLRIKMHLEAFSHEEWCELIERAYFILEEFRMKAAKRIWVDLNYIDYFNHPRVLLELKRWTAMNAGYKNNSLFSYIVYDSCRNFENMVDFFYDPYEFIRQGKKGTNVLKPLVKFIEDCPELMDIITVDYGKAAY